MRDSNALEAGVRVPPPLPENPENKDVGQKWDFAPSTEIQGPASGVVPLPGQEGYAAKIYAIAEGSWRNARRRARQDGIEFDIERSDVGRLLNRHGGRCAITRIPFRADEPSHGCFRAPFRPSLDRIISARGYVKGNVRFVLTIVNLAMNDWGQEPLIEIAQAIADRYPTRRIPACGILPAILPLWRGSWAK